MNPNTTNQPNLPRPITRAEWWTLGIGIAIIIIIFLLMLYTGSYEPTTTSSSTTNVTSTMSQLNTSTSSSAAINTATNTNSLTVAEPNDIVTVNYTGKLANGTVFDSSASHGQPFTFTLGVGQVIPGWDKGIVGMKVGQTKTLVIPPNEAYGAQGVKNPSTGKYIIPPNSTLTFTVQLVSVQPPSAGK